MKKSVLLRAPLLTNSGYGIHSRQIFEWLCSRKDFEVVTQCLQWGATPWMVNPSAEGGIMSKIMSKSTDAKGPFDISFQVQLPDEWDPSLARTNIGVTALVETDRCNYTWLEKIEAMDRVIVPSKFTKDIILNSFGQKLDKKIAVIPEWFNECLSYKKQKLDSVKDDRYKFDTKFNFMTIGTLTSSDSLSDRKNLANTIAWFLETFEGQKDVGLVVKTCMGRGSKVDRNLTESGLRQLITSTRKSEFPKIYLIHGNMTNIEVAALFKSRIHCYISATRGEGYGLPLIEAAASGIPIAATNWSGHLDFLGDDFIKVDYEMVNIPDSRVDNRIFISGAKWAEPKKESFTNSLSNLKENYQEHLKKSRKLKKKIESKFSKDKICKKYDKFLEAEFNL